MRATLSAVFLAVSIGQAQGSGTPPVTADSHVILVRGLGGESYYDELFQRWSSSFLDVARQRLGIARENVQLLAPEGESGRADRESVLAAIAEAEGRSRPGDRLVLLLIGHGSVQPGREPGEPPRARFNLPGPDLSPEALDQALSRLQDRTVVVVNASSASGAFLAPLSRPGRIVITATSSAQENQHARFAGHFVGAFTEAGADADKDGRVSVLEAFQHANRGVAREFRAERRLRTEHAVLDDDGDGAGSREPGTDPMGDGALAARVHLEGSLAPGGGEMGRRRVRLEVEARRLVDAVEALKRRKPYTPPALYLRELETLLVELALNRRLNARLESP